MGTWDTLPTPSGIPTPSPTSTDTQWQTPKHIRLASVRYASYWNTFCYEVGEGYVFTGVCLSTGGHACHVHPPPCHACPPPCTPTVTHAPRPLPCTFPVYYDMRSMSGRYKSYWNAFLLHSVFKVPSVLQRNKSVPQ